MRFNISGETFFYSAGEDIAKNITCPAIAFNGRQDITTQKVMTSENRTWIKQIEQVYYYDCAHSILVDNLEQFAKDFLEFVNR